MIRIRMSNPYTPVDDRVICSNRRTLCGNQLWDCHRRHTDIILDIFRIDTGDWFCISKNEPGTTQGLPTDRNNEIADNTRGRKKERAANRSHRKTERSQRPLIGDQPDWVRNALIGAVIMGIIIATLGFDYVTNPDHSQILYPNYYQFTNPVEQQG